MNSIAKKRIRLSDTIMYGLIYLCAGISVLLIAGIIIYVFCKGFSQISWEFLTTTTSILKGTVGIAGNILNTVYIIVLTMLLATPIGVGAAIYLNEYAKPGKLVKVIELATETLAGIPSIIFGMFGMMFFGTTLGLKYSILTGTLTLTIQLYLSAQKGEFDVAFGIALVLLVIVLGINMITKFLAKRLDVNRL